MASLGKGVWAFQRQGDQGECGVKTLRLACPFASEGWPTCTPSFGWCAYATDKTNGGDAITSKPQVDKDMMAMRQRPSLHTDTHLSGPILTSPDASAAFFPPFRKLAEPC